MSLVPNNYGPGSYIGPSVDDVSSFQSRPIRTPSPTPSELIEEKQPFRLINWKVVANYRSWFTRRAIPWIIAGAVFFTIIILMSVFHRQIVDWLTPFSRDLKKLPAGWVIPIIILFVLSFPPLFGHEIVAILCGVVWGLWVGFGIVAVGTLLGEIGNFYAFRYLLTKRGEKLERTNLKYAALAKLIRRGGYLIPIVARFSAIPGHFTTAVFSTCGMNIWVFIISATVSLPKQLTTVYLGVIIEESSSNTQSKKSKIISDTVLIVSIFITIIAAWWIFREMTKVKPEAMRDMRRRRAMQKWEIENSSNSTDRLALHAFNADDSDEEREAGMRQPVPLRMESQRYDVDEPLQTNQLYDPSPIAGKVRFQERAGRQSGEDLTWDPANDGGSTVYSLKPQYVARNQTSDLEDQSTSTPPITSLSRLDTGASHPDRPVYYSSPPGDPPQPYRTPASQQGQSMRESSISPPQRPSPPPQLIPSPTPQVPTVPAHMLRYGLRDEGPVPVAVPSSYPPTSIAPPQPSRE